MSGSERKLEPEQPEDVPESPNPAWFVWITCLEILAETTDRELMCSVYGNTVDSGRGENGGAFREFEQSSMLSVGKIYGSGQSVGSLRRFLGEFMVGAPRSGWNTAAQPELIRLRWPEPHLGMV